MKIKAYHDIFVKYLFGSEGNEDLLLQFINAVLMDSGFDKITSVEIRDPFNFQESLNDKLSILDVKAKDDKGHHYNVEIQVQGNETHKNRVLYYWAKMYAIQLNKGDSYAKLKPVISINILSFDLIKSYPDYHSLFYISNSKNPNLVLTDHLYIHFLELSKFIRAKRFPS